LGKKKTMFKTWSRGKNPALNGGLDRGDDDEGGEMEKEA